MVEAAAAICRDGLSSNQITPSYPYCWMCRNKPGVPALTVLV